MTSLFDQEKAVEMYGYERERKGQLDERRRNIQSMSKFLSVEQIAQYLEIPVEEVAVSIKAQKTLTQCGLK